MNDGIFGFVGVFLGGGITYLLQRAQYRRENEKQRLQDEGRKALLRQLLDDQKHDWRTLTTLSRVIGANTEETAKLLIQIDARGSEKDDELWGYIKDHPLPAQR